MARILAAIGCLWSAAGLLSVSVAGDAPASQPVAVEANESPRATSQQAPPTAPPTAAKPVTPRSLLDFDEFTFELGFEGSYDQLSTRYDADTSLRRSYQQTNRARRFEETVGLRTSGTLLDPRLLLFDITGRWGLSQESFSEARPGPNLREHSHGSLLEYDVALTLLPQGKLSAVGYAQQLDSRVPRAFQPSLERTRERYGGEVRFNDPRLPMVLSFEHVWDELDSRTGNLYSDERRGRDTLRYEATWQITDRHSLRLDYEYDDRSEQYSGGDTRFDTTRNYITLDHVLRFGKQGRSSWETSLRFQDETGDLARDNIELATRLRVAHSDALATNYALQFLRDDFQGLSSRTLRGEGGVSYQLGDSLTAALQLYGLRQNGDASTDFTEWGGLATAAYSRQNKLGRFSANLSYNHAATDTKDGNREGIVIAESVTFRDPLASYLVHSEANVLSIVVTDANRSRIYLAGRDYSAFRLGRYTALRRIPTGQINDRQTVLVSYTYRVFSDYDVARDRVDLRVQQVFDCGLTPYYAASLQNEDLDQPRFLSYRARNVNRQRVGVTYRQRRWSAGLEFEYNDDAIDPYQAAHCNGDVVLWQSARQQLDAKTTIARFWFDGSDGLASRNTTLLDLGASYRCLLRRDLELNAAAMYRYEDDSLFGVTHGADLSAAVDWMIGHFTVRFEAEYDLLDLPGSRSGGASVWIKLKREIPLLARPRG